MVLNLGRRSSSIDLLGPHIIELIRGKDTNIKVIIKPHPHLSATNPALIDFWRRRANPKENIEFIDSPDFNIMNIYPQCDLMISDVSSAALAWLAVDKPLICVADAQTASKSQHYSPNGLEWKMHHAAILIKDPNALNAAVVYALNNPEHKGNERKLMRNTLFGNLTDGLGSERIAAKIIDYITRGKG